MLLPDWIVLYMAVAGIAALIVGQRKLGIGLIMPACVRWLILPLLWPQLQRLSPLIIVVAIPVVAIFGGLLVLDRVVSTVYGPRAGGHVTGEYLVRVLDAIGRSTLWLLVVPFRLCRHGWRSISRGAGR